MLEDSLEEIEETSLAMILKRHRPCVFYGSAPVSISLEYSIAGESDPRIVLLTVLSLQTAAELQILAVACWLNFWEVDVGKSCAGTKAKEED